MGKHKVDIKKDKIKNKKKESSESLVEVKKNDLLTLTIDNIGSEGEGIGRYHGYTLFVKDAVVGDVITAKVMKTKKTYGYARLVDVIEPSPYRVTPPCEVARQCGGCQIQHLAYEKQLEYKENKVKACLERIGGLDQVDDIMEPIVGMENPYYYRNKAQFPVGKGKDGEIVIGFYAGRTHSIIDHDHCHIGAPINEQIIGVVKEFLKEFHIDPYDEESHEGLVRHILTRVGYVTGEVMVCIVINGNDLPHKEILVDRLCAITEKNSKQQLDQVDMDSSLLGEQEEFTHTEGDSKNYGWSPNLKMTSISLNMNKEKTNVILGQKIKTIWGQEYITDCIGDVRYRISPLSFYQVNPIQTKKLYELALDYAELTGEEVVWDLYCGIGTISLFLAQKAKEVYGVEIIPQAIEDAKENAKLNNITNVKFFVGAAEEVLPKQYKENNVAADIIVVDPPRKGCDETLLETIIQMSPKKVVYVSCDPATLARDLKYLTEHGYEVKKVRAVDQFSHSVHVETVALLSQ